MKSVGNVEKWKEEENGELEMFTDMEKGNTDRKRCTDNPIWRPKIHGACAT